MAIKPTILRIGLALIFLLTITKSEPLSELILTREYEEVVKKLPEMSGKPAGMGLKIQEKTLQ